MFSEEDVKLRITAVMQIKYSRYVNSASAEWCNYLKDDVLFSPKARRSRAWMKKSLIVEEDARKVLTVSETG